MDTLICLIGAYSSKSASPDEVRDVCRAQCWLDRTAFIGLCGRESIETRNCWVYFIPKLGP